MMDASRSFASDAQRAAFEALERLPNGAVPAKEARSALDKLAQEGLLNAPSQGRTLLGLAAGLGRRDWVVQLLRMGASPSAPGEGGATPLHMIARYHHPELAPLLLRAGADPSALDSRGLTAMDLAVGRHAVSLLDAIQEKMEDSPAQPEAFARFSDPAISGFLRHVAWRADRLGVEFRLVDAPAIAYNGNPQLPVSGFFVEHPRPVLGVAIGKDPQEWLEVLAHESSHMDQWAQNCPAWHNNTMADGREAVDWIDDWISGKEFTPEELEVAFRAAKGVELDCERRTLVKIGSFGLPLVSGEYAQRANSYVHFYEHVKKIRAWNETGAAPYQVKAVWSQAPNEMVDAPTPAMEAAYEKFWPSPAAIKPARRRP